MAEKFGLQTVRVCMCVRSKYYFRTHAGLYILLLDGRLKVLIALVLAARLLSPFLSREGVPSEEPHYLPSAVIKRKKA